VPLTVSAVLFDFDHTLAIAHHVEETVLQNLARKYGVPVPGVVELSQSLQRFRHGEETLDEMLDGVLGNAIPGASVESEFRTESLRLLPERLRPMPGLNDMLGRLVAMRVPIAILTNGWTELQRAKAAMIGFPGPVYSSEEIDAWKPDPLAFSYATSAMRVLPATALYVGDSPPTDIVGAKAAGMLAAWADLEHAAYPKGIVAPDLTIKALDELPSLIRSAPKQVGDFAP
jgi:HAD superfamily hydrolase (TIGR01549 family)